MGTEGVTIQLNNEVVSVFPNPCTSQLNINNIDRTWKSYKILDLNGNVHLNGQLESDIEQINLDLSEGIYLIQFFNDKDSHTERITILEN